MDTTQVLVFVALAAIVIITQMGTRTFTLQRFLLPLVASLAVGYHYFHGLPVAGGDVPFVAICTIAGLALGILAAALVQVERDVDTGKIVTRAGIAYASLWIIAFGSRIAFGWAASHIWQHQVALFSVQHAITSPAAWTAAFVMMAIAMVAARTLINGARALQLSRGSLVSILAR
ncbi:MAG TPA: hypothetical protein VF898_00770 [Chloroflexota bacterium]